MQGKEKIFEQLFHSHYEAMYRLAFTYLHDKEESRDIVSEVFARLWDSGLPVRADMQRPFLLACIRNRCLNVIRAKAGMRDFVACIRWNNLILRYLRKRMNNV